MRLSFNDKICEIDLLACIEKNNLHSEGFPLFHYEEKAIEELLGENGLPLIYGLSRYPGWAKDIDSQERLLFEMRMWLMGSFNFKHYFKESSEALASPIITQEAKILSLEGLSTFYLSSALGLVSVPIALIKSLKNIH